VGTRCLACLCTGCDVGVVSGSRWCVCVRRFREAHGVVGSAGAGGRARERERGGETRVSAERSDARRSVPGLPSRTCKAALILRCRWLCVFARLVPARVQPARRSGRPAGLFVQPRSPRLGTCACHPARTTHQPLVAALLTPKGERHFCTCVSVLRDPGHPVPRAPCPVTRDPWPLGRGHVRVRVRP